MSSSIAGEIAASLDSGAPPAAVERAGCRLPSVFDVSGLAAAAIGAATAEIGALLAEHGHAPGEAVVDQALASAWFGFTIKPIEFELPPVWDAIAGDYRCADGWIKLHTNAPHHRAAALEVLDTPAKRDVVAAEVATRTGAELEADIVSAGGCAAEMRTIDAWASHPQGAAVAAEPLIAWSEEPAPWQPSDPSRPLAGLRVLDLTRILAGPTCTRFLAGWGAEVLRIDPVDWAEPLLEPEVTIGKHCARLDLRADPGALDALAADADVVVHGYRPGALAGLGVAPFDRSIDVALDAYGWSGPWSMRRGFDSLVQMSSGIAAAGMATYERDVPTPLPVQALDHAAGYLLAAAVVRALRGGPRRARVSLARTAKLLTEHLGDPDAVFDDVPATMPEATVWGRAERVVPPARIGSTAMSWDRPANPLGSSPPTWPS